MSNTDELLRIIFESEGLPPPAVLPWPLSAEAEEERKAREAAFRGSAAAHPPEGMEWLAAHAGVKYRPDKVLEGCRSILVTHLPYFRDDLRGEPPVPARRSPEPAGGSPGDPGSAPAAGRVARYARGRDYHKELGGRLRRIVRKLQYRFPDHAFRGFTDIGPLDEIWLAEAAGLGFRGRHGLLIHPEHGSWIVLGHILATLPFPAAPDRPPAPSCPAGCRRCIDACPVGALSLPGRLDASKCLSCRTIESPGAVNESDRPAVGDRIFGCDSCQEACPFNAAAPPTHVAAFLADIAGAFVPLAEILTLRTHEDVVARFAGSPLMRAGRDGLVRNACTAAGNSDSPELLPLLEALLDDESDVVREHAAWAVERLSGGLTALSGKAGP